MSCEDCRELAEANGDKPDCENCGHGREPVYASQRNYDAVNAWRKLDLFGRVIDTFAGVPLPLSLDAIALAAKEHVDPYGIKWRVIMLEERIYERRVKKFNADSSKRSKGKK